MLTGVEVLVVDVVVVVVVTATDVVVVDGFGLGAVVATVGGTVVFAGMSGATGTADIAGMVPSAELGVVGCGADVDGDDVVVVVLGNVVGVVI